MITLKDYLEAIDYRITGGSEYQWKCFGPNARYLDCDSPELNVYNVSCVFDVSKYYQSQICMLVDDTSSTGYASDSINGIWKIQFGWSMPGSAGVNDTMWLPSATVDSIITAKFGTVTASTLDSLGNFIPRLRCVDTLSVSGYAIAYGPVLTNQPYRWARVIWSGHAGNKVGRKILLKACQFIHPTSRVSNYPAWGW